MMSKLETTLLEIQWLLLSSLSTYSVVSSSRLVHSQGAHTHPPEMFSSSPSDYQPHRYTLSIAEICPLPGPRVVRMGPLCFLAGCHIRQLNQGFAVLFDLATASFCVCFFCVSRCVILFLCFQLSEPVQRLPGKMRLQNDLLASCLIYARALLE